ncbi:hypothetical protein [Piscinibacter sp.]|uniref:hypothetical protein n=1 Tax=Piscinibacter sp. TaxID=1903157 RepID=UPI002C236CE4|nr:hypothetical protein [Albitalea sp.]HUG24125.1 hypothetical protein [Albitalea sp.]
MRNVIRLALLWLVAMALPLQGAAAATMLHCAPAHHRDAMSAAHDHHHGAAYQRHDHAHHGPLSTGEHTAHDTQTAEDDAATSAHGPDALNKVSCSACAACSSGIALPATPVLLSPPALVHGASPAPSFDAAVFLTDGPERPPRTLLATRVR